MIWFTSDLHFWHKNIIGFCNRPFMSVEEMNDRLVQMWNMYVKPEDTVYVIGDFSLAFRPVELYVKELRGKKILIAGNHDFCHPAHRKSKHEENHEKWVKAYLDAGFDEVHTELIIELDGTKFLLCHLPYLEPNYLNQDVRYPAHRPKDEGRILLCGHVHTKWKTRRTPKDTLMINVGVDVWNYRPINIEDIRKVLNE